MGDFFEVNSKSVMKLYINQVAMAVFGLMVIGAAAGSESNTLVFFASLISVGLYMFIIYSMMWEAGAKVAAKTLRAEDSGVRKIYTPFMIVLFGSVFNIFCYVNYMILQIYVSVNNITDTAAKSMSIGYLIERIMRMLNSAYMGFEMLIFPNPNIELHEKGEELINTIMYTPWYYFFLTLLPIFAVGITAYYLGGSEISILRKLGIKTKNKRTANTHIDYSKNKK